MSLAFKIEKPKRLKAALVAAVVLILAAAGFAIWIFIFSAEGHEPLNMAEIVRLSGIDEALFQAVRDDDIEAVLRCLSEGGSAFAVNEKGTTPFHAAIALNRADVVREFVNAGVGDPGKWDSLLIYAVTHNRPQAIKELARLSPNIDAYDRNGATPLLYAVANNNMPAVRELLKIGADVNAKGRGGVTPLIAAIRAARPAMVKELLKAGADTSIALPSGETPLDFAYQTNRQVLVALIEEAEAPVETMTLEDYLKHNLSDDVSLEEA
jgi:ankyrin repeat protein